MTQSSLESGSGVHRAITDRIIAAIEAGAGQFVMPWHLTGPGHGRPANAVTGYRYRGGNVVALWAEAMLTGFQSGHWATYKQWQDVGAQVRAGERGATIVFYKFVERQTENDDERATGSALVRSSRVFNADQVDGWVQPQLSAPDEATPLPDVDAFIAATGATIRHGATYAAYSWGADRIELPERKWFVGSPTRTATNSYYATALHELVHWTGAEHRLARTFGKAFGDAAYAAEELVAELGAAFLCADLSVSNVPRPDHAAYLDHWLKILGQDSRALFTAARLATTAATYLGGRIPPSEGA